MQVRPEEGEGLVQGHTVRACDLDPPTQGSFSALGVPSCLGIKGHRRRETCAELRGRGDNGRVSGWAARLSSFGGSHHQALVPIRAALNGVFLIPLRRMGGREGERKGRLIWPGEATRELMLESQTPRKTSEAPEEHWTGSQGPRVQCEGATASTVSLDIHFTYLLSVC